MPRFGFSAVRCLAPVSFALCAAFLAGTASAQNVKTRHLREIVADGAVQPVGRLAKSQVMNLDLVLPMRDPDGLKAFLQDLYNPSSSSFRHFLTPAQFTARFGPTQAQFDTVVAFAKQNGLAVTGGSLNSRDVQVQASAATVEKAFHINLMTFNHPVENRVFFSPDREPTTTLPFALWHVSGLEDYSLPHPLSVKKTDFAAANGIQPEAIAKATTGSGPSASFLGSDMRSAYYGKGTLTGAGQSLALWEYAGTNLADLDTYYQNIGQTYDKSKVHLISVDGTATACNYTRKGGWCDDGEQNLDMTQALGMAPGLDNLDVFIGSSDVAIVSAMVTAQPLPLTIGCSWGWTPVDPSTLDPYFQQMAAQGQNFFAASGDSSTWSRKNQAWPADDAYVTAVGGTDLVTSGPGGAWASETAWVDSGGGVSPGKIAIPEWQVAAVANVTGASKVYRNGPDVAANANFTFYTCDDQQACLANQYGGTSFAAPMWAAYVALVNQARTVQQKAPLGFLNPIIYAGNAGAGTYANDFHDIVSGKSGSFSAVPGFDLVTGWGSPTPALVYNLATEQP